MPVNLNRCSAVDYPRVEAFVLEMRSLLFRPTSFNSRRERRESSATTFVVSVRTCFLEIGNGKSPQKLEFARELGILGRSFNNAKSQLGGFPFELSDLTFPVLRLVEFRSLVYVFHPVADHPVDQSRQFGGHGFDRNGGTELGSESAKLSSQIGVAYP